MHERHWISPGALGFAQLSHGASWVLLAYVAVRAGINLSAPALAWIHLVALGWFSTAALAILIHVIPAFTDLEWSYEPLARWALAPFALGVVFFVAAWLIAPSRIAFGGAVITMALAGYLFAASTTLLKGRRLLGTERVVSGALELTLGLLAATAALGVVMLMTLAGAAPSSWLMWMPAVHATAGFYGWLSLLVFGVSVRTIRPIAGVSSRFRWIHIAVGALMPAGMAVVATGLALGARSVEKLGAVCLAFAVAAYVFDLGATLSRATVPHRPPQAFIAAALGWLVVSSVLGGGILLGAPWQNAYGFIFLIGWVGQIVNAHMFHIGVRLIATIYRGDDDETLPAELLDARLSWSAFGGMQAAVALCGWGLLRASPAYVASGAIVGFLAWCAIAGNLVVARSRAARPSVIVSLV